MYKALIIGAGQIAAGFDTPSGAAVLTHAHAYKDNPDIELLGFYDTDYKKAQQAAEKWGAQAFKELKKADIISICAPDKHHAQAVLDAEKLSPELIFLEKPACCTKAEAEILKKVKTPILVNYSRCFSKSFQALAERVKSGVFGAFQTGCAYYGKGFIHNGSHLINLLNMLIGKIKNINVFDETADFFENDKTKSAVLTFENGGKLVITGCDCRNYTVFECDLMFEKARIRIINSGFDIEIYEVKESGKFKGYKNLILSETIKTDLDYAMKNAVSNIINFLNGKEQLLCTLNDGIEALCL